ncbi:hypothetical protein TWF173_002060 [Orbilia oligospora]|nr:hypothetical protein TWF173_002060 [Orbilia oligospora]
MSELCWYQLPPLVMMPRYAPTTATSDSANGILSIVYVPGGFQSNARASRRILPGESIHFAIIHQNDDPSLSHGLAVLDNMNRFVGWVMIQDHHAMWGRVRGGGNIQGRVLVMNGFTDVIEHEGANIDADFDVTNNYGAPATVDWMTIHGELPKPTILTPEEFGKKSTHPSAIIVENLVRPASLYWLADAIVCHGGECLKHDASNEDIYRVNDIGLQCQGPNMTIYQIDEPGQVIDTIAKLTIDNLIAHIFFGDEVHSNRWREVDNTLPMALGRRCGQRKCLRPKHLVLEDIMVAHQRTKCRAGYLRQRRLVECNHEPRCFR